MRYRAALITTRAVNTASRLEGVNKYFGTRICISESTRAQVSDIAFRPINVIVPKGKEEPLGIYEPLDEDRANSPDPCRAHPFPTSLAKVSRRPIVRLNTSRSGVES